MSFLLRYGFPLSTCVVVATFLADLHTPLGNLVGGLYALAVLLASLGKDRSSLIAISLTAVFLTWVGSLRLAGGEVNPMEYSMAAIWVALALPFGLLLCSAPLDGKPRRWTSTEVESFGRETRQIGHGISNVLQVILGLAYMMEEDLDEDDPRRDEVQVILSSARDGSKLAEKLHRVGRQMTDLRDPEIITYAPTEAHHLPVGSEPSFP